VNIALDYDNTFTRDPETWLKVIQVFRDAGHKVYVVTMRYNNDETKPVNNALEGKVDGIFFTSRKAKRPFMFQRGIDISVWMDDTPFFVDNDARE
jgi:hypothetical protein